MLYNAMVALIWISTTIALVFFVIHLHYRRAGKVKDYEKFLNLMFAGEASFLLLVQFICFLSILSYAALVLPFIDAWTFQRFDAIADGGLITVWGSFYGISFGLYAITIAVNVIGVFACVKIAKAAGFLRRGYIYITIPALVGLTIKKQRVFP